MVCPKCNYNIPSSVDTCPYCQACFAPMICPTCEHAISSIMSICPHCGSYFVPNLDREMKDTIRPHILRLTIVLLFLIGILAVPFASHQRQGISFISAWTNQNFVMTELEKGYRIPLITIPIFLIVALCMMFLALKQPRAYWIRILIIVLFLNVLMIEYLGLVVSLTKITPLEFGYWILRLMNWFSLFLAFRLRNRMKHFRIY